MFRVSRDFCSPGISGWVRGVDYEWLEASDWLKGEMSQGWEAGQSRSPAPTAHSPDWIANNVKELVALGLPAQIFRQELLSVPAPLSAERLVDREQVPHLCVPSAPQAGSPLLLLRAVDTWNVTYFL